jgi:hypothetical protein
MYRYLLSLLLVLMVGCSSKKVETDYNPAFSTDALKTFAVVHQSMEGYDTLDDERIRGAIIREMELKGYEAAPQDIADFHVTFQTTVEEDVPSNVSFGFGVGTFSSGMGTSIGTTHNVTDDKESLLINVVDPKTQKTFWRAEVSDKRRDFRSPEARSDYFGKTVAAMLKSFPARSSENRSE